MLGVTASTGSYGIYNLNQGVYTVMSYNDAWDFHPDGPTSEHPTGAIGLVIDRDDLEIGFPLEKPTTTRPPKGKKRRS